MQAQVVEKKGKSVDEAVQAALEELGCELEKVNIEVIEEPSKGLLGIGKKLALIRVTRIIEASDADKVRSTLEVILGKMDLDYTIDSVEEDADNVRINVVGKDKGLLIGRKGETLNAVQYIVSLIVNKNSDHRIKFFLDVENYRKKRENSLEDLAVRLADKVKKTRKNVVMRPMSSQERRVIHTALQADPNVNTYSMGDEPNRKVVISLKK